MPVDDFTTPEPHDLAAEQSVLGSMMLSAAAAEACMSVLSGEDFYRPGHGVIFAAAGALHRAGQSADALRPFKDDAAKPPGLACRGGPL